MAKSYWPTGPFNYWISQKSSLMTSSIYYMVSQLQDLTPNIGLYELPKQIFSYLGVNILL